MPKKISSKNLALLMARAALDKKAHQVVIIDVKDKVDYTDYLVVCSGNSKVHVRAIYEHLTSTLKRKGLLPLGIEGEMEGNWILMDYGSVVVHVFYTETRYYYDIEGLWLDARRIEFEQQET